MKRVSALLSFSVISQQSDNMLKTKEIQMKFNSNPGMRYRNFSQEKKTFRKLEDRFWHLILYHICGATERLMFNGVLKQNLKENQKLFFMMRKRCVASSSIYSYPKSPVERCLSVCSNFLHQTWPRHS